MGANLLSHRPSQNNNTLQLRTKNTICLRLYMLSCLGEEGNTIPSASPSGREAVTLIIIINPNLVQ